VKYFNSNTCKNTKLQSHGNNQAANQQNLMCLLRPDTYEASGKRMFNTIFTKNFYKKCVFKQEIDVYSSDFNTTSLNWWMETTAEGGRATPEYGNATGFNRWLFILSDFGKNNTCGDISETRIYRRT